MACGFDVNVCMSMVGGLWSSKCCRESVDPASDNYCGVAFELASMCIVPVRCVLNR